MAAQYTIIYTYAGQDNTSGKRSVAFNRFTASGDTNHRISQITSITYEHYHTSTSSMTWNLRGRLVFADGSTLDSSVASNRISGTKVKFTNYFSDLPTAEKFATLAYVQTLDSQDKITSGGYSAKLYWRATSDYPMRIIITFIEEMPVVYAPTIESFSLQRCNEGGKPDDEGLYIATSMKLGIGNAAGLGSARLRVYYAANTYPIVGESQYVDLGGHISELLSGVEFDTRLLTGVWNAGSTWYFAAVFSIGEETDIATGFVARSSASFHISDEPGGGAAVGGFSSGTTANPKFESHVPAHFYAGIKGVTNYTTNEENTGGKWIDGKPIYRKMYFFENISIPSGWLSTTLGTVSNLESIDTFVDISGVVKYYGEIYPLGRIYGTETFSSVFVNTSGQIVYHNCAPMSATLSYIVVVLQYTKK